MVVCVENFSLPVTKDVTIIDLATAHQLTPTGLFDAVVMMSLHTALTVVVAWLIVLVIATTGHVTFLSILSLKKSWNELVYTSNDRLGMLDVFRLMAIIWVMINHTGSEGRVDILDRKPSGDVFKAAVHNHPIFGALLGNSALGVEIFLVLSGLLSAVTWYRLAEKPFWSHYTSFIVKRWLRLYPSVTVFIFLATGPIMQTLLPRFYGSMVSTCGNYGTASQLLFLQNWQATPTCFGYLWYLGLDMQLHFCAPFLLHMLYRNTKRAILLAFTLVGLSVILRAGHCIFYNVCDQSDVDIPFISYPGQDVAQSAHIYAGIWELYARPYTKCGPFILGMLVGFSMSKVKLQISSALSNAILAVSLFLAIACIYAILPEYWYPHLGNTLYTVAYTATFRTFFAAVFCIAVLVLFYRSDRIRVRPIFPVLARLTFNAYLLHMPMVFVMNHLPFLQSAQSPYELVAVVPIVAILSFLASFVFYLTVESPLGRVSKSILNAAYKSN